MSNYLQTPLVNDIDPNEQRDSRYSFHRTLDPFEIETLKDDEPSEQPTFFQNLERKYKSRIAYYYMICSALFMGGNAVCVKLISRIPPFELLFFRSFFLILLLGVYISKIDKKVNINDKKNKKLIIIQSILAFILGYCYFYGIKNMPLSEAVVVMYTNPMFSGFLAWILVKEYYANYEKVCALISFLGVLFIIRPDFIFGAHIQIIKNYDEDVRQYGGFICLVGSFMLSLNGIFIKLSGRNLHPLLLVLYGAVISFLASPIACLIFEGFTMPKVWEWVYIFLMAFFNFFGQFFMTKSYQMSEKTIGITVVNYIQMMFVYIFDIFVVKEIPELLSIIGSVFIISSCLYILLKMRK